MLTLGLFKIAKGGHPDPTGGPSRRAFPRRRDEWEEEAWDRSEHLLPARPDPPGTTGHDHRLFVKAGLGGARTGAPGRDRPERFGNGNSLFPRFNRWAKRGVGGRIMEALGGDADLEWLLIDSTVVRAHPHAAGAGKKGPTTRR